MIKIANNLLKLADIDPKLELGYGSAGALLGGIGGAGLYHLLSKNNPEDRDVMNYLLAGLTGGGLGAVAGGYAGPKAHTGVKNILQESLDFKNEYGDLPTATAKSKARAQSKEKELKQKNESKDKNKSDS